MTDTSQEKTQQDSNSSEQSNTPPRPPPRTAGVQSLSEHVSRNKIDMGLLATRFLTIIFAIAYVIPIFGNAQSAYYKVLMANAATSALRLHQRLPQVQFTKEFLARLLLEDSCHYLFFSLIFLYVSPVLLIILPVVLFAILHAASYSLTILDIIGQNYGWAARMIISLVELQTRNMLRLAAFTEIFLMPLAIILVFSGRAGLMTPFIYYHFLVLRYSSRRNPHARNVFHELRIAVEHLAGNPKTPSIISKVLRSGVSLVSRLAPAEQPQQ
jgi:hypothetical protein